MWRYDANQSTPRNHGLPINAELRDRTLQTLEKLVDRESEEWGPYLSRLEVCDVHCGAALTNGGTVVWSVMIIGNSGVGVTQCEVRDAPPSASCQPKSIEFEIIRTENWYSPNGRWMLTRSEHINSAPLQVLDLVGYGRVQLGRVPAGRVVQALFTSSPERLLLLTENDEVWFYEYDASAWRLQRRVPIATLVGDSSDACHYRGTSGNYGRLLLDRPLLSLSPTLVLAINTGCTLLSIDPSTGDLRWRAPLARPSVDERIELVSAPGGTVVAVMIGSRLRLFHTGTGAPLSDPIDIETLFAGAKPEYPSVTVALSGEIRITSTNAGAAIRQAPPLEQDFKKLSTRLHARTGISISPAP